MPVFLEHTGASEDETKQASPLAKIAQEQDPLDVEELRDQVPPLASPVSSKSSSVSTRSSGRRSGRSRVGERHKKQPSLYSNQSATRSETTIFSGVSSIRSGSHVSGKDSVSTRSVSSATSSRHGSSRLRHQILRSPEEAKALNIVDLFPFTKSRLSEVPFTSPRYEGLSVDDLRSQMLSIVFGWDGDIEELIRDERKYLLVFPWVILTNCCRRTTPAWYDQLRPPLQMARRLRSGSGCSYGRYRIHDVYGLDVFGSQQHG